MHYYDPFGRFSVAKGKSATGQRIDVLAKHRAAREKEQEDGTGAESRPREIFILDRRVDQPPNNADRED